MRFRCQSGGRCLLLLLLLARALIAEQIARQVVETQAVEMNRHAVASGGESRACRRGRVVGTARAAAVMVAAAVVAGRRVCVHMMMRLMLMMGSVKMERIVLIVSVVLILARIVSGAISGILRRWRQWRNAAHRRTVVHGRRARTSASGTTATVVAVGSGGDGGRRVEAQRLGVVVLVLEALDLVLVQHEAAVEIVEKCVDATIVQYLNISQSNSMILEYV